MCANSEGPIQCASINETNSQSARELGHEASKQQKKRTYRETTFTVFDSISSIVVHVFTTRPCQGSWRGGSPHKVAASGGNLRPRAQAQLRRQKKGRPAFLCAKTQTRRSSSYHSRAWARSPPHWDRQLTRRGRTESAPLPTAARPHGIKSQHITISGCLLCVTTINQARATNHTRSSFE